MQLGVGDRMLSSCPDSQGSQYMEVYGQPMSGSPSQECQYLRGIVSEDLVVGLEDSRYELIQQCDEKEITPQMQVIHQVLPDLEEHDKGNLNFELNLEPQHKGKVNWFYSKLFNKLYIKINEIFNVEAVYNSTLNFEQFYMRIMMVFNCAVSEPVVRCENHSSKDSATEKNIKHSVLRCENPSAIYLGTTEGKNVSDRLSVRIPLCRVQPNEDNLIKQTVALKFVCQNSCVGRRETSIIFYLENANGEILAKRTTAVKICSCPKRDMKKDECSSEIPKKRSRKDECPAGKKILKLESDIKVEIGKEDEDEDDSFTAAAEANDIVVTPNGVKLNLDLPDLEAAYHVMECAFNKVAGQMALNPDNKLMHSKMRALKKNFAKVQKLREQSK